MRKLLNTYFSISKREFNGLLALVILILLIAAIPRLYFAAATQHPARAAVGELTLALKTRERRYHPPKAYYAGERKKAQRNVVRKLFVFDPNVIGAEDWQRLGLSARQSAVIINYRAKGAKFRRAEDLQKMYTINEEMYKRLLPYVKIAPPLIAASPYGNSTYSQKLKKSTQEVSIVELNGADSATLVGIRGIGPAFAIRILKYRERLGGFHKKEQLMEVYGLDSAKYYEIKDQVSLDLGNLRKIDINDVETADFKGHPYIKYKQANAIIQYRKQHGNYADIADLSKVLILDAETINRLAPYLNFKQ